MNDFKCGIAGFGFAFPETTRSCEEIAQLSGLPLEVIRDKYGINKIYYPGHDEQTSDLAVAAAKDCLKNTGVDPKDIDLIIYFGENYGDYIIYSIGPKVQYQIGAVNAWCYQMENKCGSFIVAMDQAKKYIQTEENIHTVMLVGGYRNVDKVDYKDQDLSFFYHISCGGAACIIKEGLEDRQILGNANIVDGSFYDCIAIPGGGTKLPITKDNIDDPYIQYFRVLDKDAVRNRLGTVKVPNLKKVAELALEKSGYTIEDIDYVCDPHLNNKSHAEIMEMFGVPLEKTCDLNDFGHVGQLDPPILMNLAESKGLIKKGDIVLCLAIGLGYIWNAGVIKW